MTILDGPFTHILTTRVYYEDTDAGGIVYHANYLRFAERGRTEALRTGGYDHHSVLKEFNILLPVRHLEIDYKAPARLDDVLHIETKVSAIGNTSLTMKQVISKENKELATLKVVIVAMTPAGRAVRFPPQLRQIFGDTASS